MNSHTTRILLTPILSWIATIVTPAVGQVVHQDHKLLANDGSAEDSFGISIDISDGIIAVGAHKDDDAGNESGSAYLFDARTGAQIAKIIDVFGPAMEEFGRSIAIDNGRVAIGAWFETSMTGAAYIYHADPLASNFGDRIAKITADDGSPGDTFGNSIAIGDDLIVVGSWADGDHGLNSGSAYVFDAATGVQLAKLTADDANSHDRFGFAVSIDSGIAAIGAGGDDGYRGAVYLFDVNPLSSTFGEQLIKLVANDRSALDLFGASVAVDNGIVVIGAPADNGENGVESGSAYFFDASPLSPDFGEQLAKVTADDGTENDQFGNAVSINNGKAVIGAIGGNGSAGSAYVFDANDMSPSFGEQVSKLTANDAATSDSFGVSVAIMDGIVAIGAHQSDDYGSSSGSAYVFQTTSCSADLDGSGDLDIFDVFAFLDLYNAMDPGADFTGNGLLDIFDVFAFLEAFNAGCP